MCVCVCVCVYVHVQRLHPDKSDSEEDAAQFRRIQRAYDVLKDKEQRRLYDGLGHEQFERYESIVLSGRGCVDVYASLKSACVCGDGERSRDGRRRCVDGCRRQFEGREPITASAL